MGVKCVSKQIEELLDCSQINNHAQNIMETMTATRGNNKLFCVGQWYVLPVLLGFGYMICSTAQLSSSDSTSSLSPPLLS